MTGPLDSVTVIELAGIGPAPYAGMVLADMGARVVKVDRILQEPLIPAPRDTEILDRGKESIRVDLKSDEGREVVLGLLDRADALIEGFRPGVTERLGLGPEVVRARNPRLVYGRITGWGQDGPLAATAGHDIDYLAVAGVLGAIGDEADPVVPLNLIADFGGGGMLLVSGVLAALIDARQSGHGSVVDAAMVDGVAHLASMMHGGIAAGWWVPHRRSNLLDGAAPFYDVYRTSDGRHMAVGALEPGFFREFVGLIGIDPAWRDRQHEVPSWPEMRTEIAARFVTETQAHWTSVFDGSDACVAPVLTLAEAPDHEHNRTRETFVDVDGVTQPGTAPRFDGRRRTPPKPHPLGADTDDILGELGYDGDHVERLRSQGVVA